MNEFYAADPNCPHSIGDLRFLFTLFGPYAGRYLAAYPDDWENRLLNHISQLPTIEAAEAKTVLRRAREKSAYLVNSSLPWSPDKEWLDNALTLKALDLPRVKDVISRSDRDAVLSFSDLDQEIPITAAEKISAIEDEYLRVTRTLMAISSELFFIDPYLSPCKKDVRAIASALINRIARSRKCESVVIYARTSLVLGPKLFSWNEVVTAWKTLLSEAKWEPARNFRYFLVDDGGATKMHRRYLFSIKGGVDLDNGFQRLPRGRIDVSPIGKRIHEELLIDYLEGKHDMKVEHEFSA